MRWWRQNFSSLVFEIIYHKGSENDVSFTTHFTFYDKYTYLHMVCLQNRVHSENQLLRFHVYLILYLTVNPVYWELWGIITTNDWSYIEVFKIDLDFPVQ